ncbi:MAG: ATP-binding protein [Pseudomonadota bacterium]
MSADGSSTEGSFLLSDNAQIALQSLADNAGDRPLWIWSANGKDLLWSNAMGLTALGIDEGAVETVSPSAPAARSLQAVARTLPQPSAHGASAHGSPAHGSSTRGRIEILRLNAGGHHETVVATCRPVNLDGLICVAATGTAGSGKISSSKTVRAPIETETTAPMSREADATPQAPAHQSEDVLDASTEEAGREISLDAADFILDIDASSHSPNLTDRVNSAGNADDERQNTGAEHAEQLQSETPDVDGVQAQLTARDLGETGGSETTLPLFTFAPRSRPHRFSFLVDQHGLIQSLSPGMEDAVGQITTLEEGQDATSSVANRAKDVPPAVIHGLEERRRFGEHTVFWPVSNTALEVPVRLSGFDEDDGTLRIFGTVMTGQSRASQTDETVSDAIDEAVDPMHEAAGATEASAVETSSEDAGETMAMIAQVPGAAQLANSQAVTNAKEKNEDERGEDERDDDQQSDGQPDFPEETLKAMKAVATGVTAGLAGTTATRLLAGDSENEASARQAPETDATEHGGSTLSPSMEDAQPEVETEPDQDTAQDATAPLSSEGEASAPLDADLSRPERLTFQEIARRLGARISGQDKTDTFDDLREASIPATLRPETSPPETSPAETPPTDDPRTDGDDTSEDDTHLPEATASVPEDGVHNPSDADGEQADQESDAVNNAGGAVINLTPPENNRVVLDDGKASLTGRVVQFTPSDANAERMVIDRLPLGVIIYTDDEMLYANRAALEMAGLAGLQALKAMPGIEALFDGDLNGQQGTMTLVRPDGSHVPVHGRLQGVRWEGKSAALLSLRETTVPTDDNTPSVSGEALSELSTVGLPLVTARIGELEAIIDLASDGVVTLTADGEIQDLNQAAQALVGYSDDDLIGRPFRLLFPEDHRQIALDYLDDIAQSGRLSLFNEGRELECLTAQGGLVPVFMTIGRLTDDEPAALCAVLRDLSPFKQAESDLVEARQAAEEASAHKSEFLARVSHEIRTPLNAVIGFSEVMLEERFGPVGSERYRQYLRDIHTSGEHLMSLLNDLLDLSKIEAGRLEVAFGEVDLNDIVQQCLAIMQPQASQGRIIVRTSLPVSLPKVVADIRSVRQVVLNLMSNAIKFTPSGGQIIVSTLYEPSGEVSLRVRDTGRGMAPEDVALALEPFRQVPTTLNEVIVGTGLGLPLTKALVEANRAQFGLESTPGEGTLAIVTFPSQRVLAE